MSASESIFTRLNAYAYTHLDSSLTGAIIIGVTYGLDVKQENDPNVLLAEKAIFSMAATGVAGTYLGMYPLSPVYELAHDDRYYS